MREGKSEEGNQDDWVINKKFCFYAMHRNHFAFVICFALYNQAKAVESQNYKKFR